MAFHLSRGRSLILIISFVLLCRGYNGIDWATHSLPSTSALCSSSLPSSLVSAASLDAMSVPPAFTGTVEHNLGAHQFTKQTHAGARLSPYNVGNSNSKCTSFFPTGTSEFAYNFSQPARSFPPNIPCPSLMPVVTATGGYPGASRPDLNVGNLGWTNGGSEMKAEQDNKALELRAQELKELRLRVKKPLNAFMVFMREQRAKVMAETDVRESAAINQILGRYLSFFSTIPTIHSPLNFPFLVSYISARADPGGGGKAGGEAWSET